MNQRYKLLILSVSAIAIVLTGLWHVPTTPSTSTQVEGDNPTPGGDNPTPGGDNPTPFKKTRV